MPESDKPKGFRNLELLGADKLAIIESMLVRGDGCPEIAKMIQSEWGASVNVSLDTLTKQIQRYKYKVITPRLAVTIKEASKKYGFKTSVRKLNDHLDIMEELYQLIETQKARIQKLMVAEEKMNEKNESAGGFNYVANPVIKQEMAVLIDLYRTTGHYQLETGVMRRTPKTIKGVIQTDPDDPSYKRFLLSIEERDQFIEKAKKIGALLDGDMSVLEHFVDDAAPIETDTGD